MLHSFVLKRYTSHINIRDIITKVVIIRHSPRRALQSIYTSKNIITNYGNKNKTKNFSYRFVPFADVAIAKARKE